MRRSPLALAAGLAAGLLAAAPLALAPSTAAAQGARPVASPRDTARGTVGGVNVMVDYGRPYKKGRAIFAADGLVPYGKVWRTGANAATTLVTAGALDVGGTRLPAGTYTLYSIPSESGWQLVINWQTGQWGRVYDQAKDVARVPMKATKLSAPVEQFTIAVEPAALVLRWDMTEARVPLKAAK
mgnify:CR=1 FL=1